MFIYICYGDNASILMNIDCGIKVFTECLRRRCNIDQSQCIDVSDEYGNIKNLSSSRYEKGKRVYELLKERNIYVLVELKTVYSDKEKEVIVKPLLKDWVPKTTDSPKLARRASFRRYSKAIITANRMLAFLEV